LAAGRSREHGDGDQLVGRLTGVTGDNSADARHQRRNADDGCRQASAKLADLPLVGLKINQQRSQAKEGDAHDPRAEAHSDAAAFLKSEGAGDSFAGECQGFGGDDAQGSSPSSPRPGAGAGAKRIRNP
jgi:hypothetical protein